MKTVEDFVNDDMHYAVDKRVWGWADQCLAVRRRDRENFDAGIEAALRRKFGSDPRVTLLALNEEIQTAIKGLLPPAAQPADEGKPASESPTIPLKQLRLEGVVSFDWGGGEDGGGEIKIGEWGLICEILKLFKSGVKVTIAIMDETFDGELFADVGCGGYSEWTPGDPAELKVGPHNIFNELGRFEGKKVTVVVADGPVNLLAEEGKP